MRNMGIHVRLMVAAFLLISATTLTLGYMGVKIIHEFVQSRFEERIRFLARYLALNAELGILIDERAMLTQLARNLLSERDVVRVSICNSKDETLADEFREDSDSGSVDLIEVPVVLKESVEESLAFQWSPFFDPKEKLIGKVRITYSTKGIHRLLTYMKVRFVWLAVGLSLVSVLIFFFISRSLVAPVTHLVRAARQVARGDLSLRVIPARLPETKELAEAFNAMLESLEQSEKALMDVNRKMVRQKTLAEVGKFSMMVAHEVKNPLSIIKSSMDLLKKDLPSPQSNTMVIYIEDEIIRLNRLIEDFLMFARPARPSFRAVDVNELLEECTTRFEHSVSAFEKQADAISIQLRLPKTPVYVHADPDLLIRAIGNILKNAYEANDHKGKIVVTAYRNAMKWVLEIVDQGSGIDPEHLDKLFEPFFTTRSKGTGLGLAFVSQVIKAHEGRVTAENHEKKGALMRVELPLTSEKKKEQ